MNRADQQLLTDRVARGGGRVSFEQPLAELTTWAIGGPAEAVVWPSSRETLREVVALAAERGWPQRVMGNGSNLLCPDEGVRGVVVNLTNSLAGVAWSDDELVAEGGVFLPKLAREAASRGLAGLECVVGVPGTIGGGCVMNAGVPDGTLGDCLVEVELLRPDGQIETRPVSALGLGHRQSRLQQDRAIVVSARLRLRADDPAAITARMDHHLAHRRRTQPLSDKTCGSVFRRPAEDHPGRLIELAGCKGLRVGAAEVSARHANWIVNHAGPRPGTGGASAADVRRLMAEIVARVERHSGVTLVPEVIVWE